MRHSLERGSLLHNMLFALALLTLLGHVCAVPAHAHEPTHEPHAEDEWAWGAPAQDGGSCEAVRASDGGPWAASGLSTGTSLAPVPGDSADLARLPGPTPRPPLFLLHAALLI